MTQIINLSYIKYADSFCYAKLINIPKLSIKYYLFCERTHCAHNP